MIAVKYYSSITGCFFFVGVTVLVMPRATSLNTTTHVSNNGILDLRYFSSLEIAIRDVASKIAKAADAEHVCPSYSTSDMVIDAADPTLDDRQIAIDNEKRSERARHCMEMLILVAH